MLVLTQSDLLSPAQQSQSPTPSTPFNNVCSTDAAHARQKSTHKKQVTPSLRGRVQHFEAFFGGRNNALSKANAPSEKDMSADMHPTAVLPKKEQGVTISSHRQVKQRGSDGPGAAKEGIAASQAGNSPRMETVDMMLAGTVGIASSKSADKSTSTPIRSLTETGSKSKFSKAIGPNLGSRFLKSLKLSLKGAGDFCLTVTTATTAASTILALCSIPVAGPAGLLIIPITAVITPLIAFPLSFAGYALGQFIEFAASTISRYRKM